RSSAAASTRPSRPGATAAAVPFPKGRRRRRPPGRAEPEALTVESAPRALHSVGADPRRESLGLVVPRPLRRVGAAALARLLASWIGSGGAAPGGPAPASGRVVILGFDGVDASIVEKMMAEGRLPRLAELKARGGYSPLTPTVPAQTPVSWATF